MASHRSMSNLKITCCSEDESDTRHPDRSKKPAVRWRDFLPE